MIELREFRHELETVRDALDVLDNAIQALLVAIRTSEQLTASEAGEEKRK